MLQWLSKFGVFVCLLLLVSCSSTTFVYNRLDFIIPWYLDDYVELDRNQSQLLDRQLAPFLAWHRQQELPRYLELIDSLDAALERSVTQSDAVEITKRFQQAWFRLEDRALDWLLVLGATLSDQQIDDFLMALWKQQGRYQKKYLKRTDAEYREDSYNNFVDGLQDYLGRLNSQQRQLLKSASEQLMRSDRVWLQERSARLHRLGGILRRENGWQQQVRAELSGDNETVSAEYREIYLHNRGVIQSAVVEVLNIRTSKQDRRLRRRFEELRQDIETLIEQGNE